jgi:hypothetical protein
MIPYNHRLAGAGERRLRKRTEAPLNHVLDCKCELRSVEARDCLRASRHFLIVDELLLTDPRQGSGFDQIRKWRLSAAAASRSSS